MRTGIILAAAFTFAGAASAQTAEEAWVNGTSDMTARVMHDAPEIAVHAEALLEDEQDGVGGPVEERSGYPPCRPGRGDDECIQLYEPGVTGAGN